MGKFTFIDLFAGIGGFRMALESLGGECLGFSEINKDAIATYCKNFHESESANFGDITKLKAIPHADILTAGVPCQSWSIAGKNLGFDDDRGQLWNDALYLLRQSQPEAFIFENVKGLADPRNSTALSYIMQRIREMGYHAGWHLINAYDYGELQHRIRIYVIGFKDKTAFRRFTLPRKATGHVALGDFLRGKDTIVENTADGKGHANWSLSHDENGINDYFLFNDIRNGATTIHSWEIAATTDRQKHICELLLRNRRKRIYGNLDGNPLSLLHFQQLDPSVTQQEIDALVDLQILKPEDYLFRVLPHDEAALDEAEGILLAHASQGHINIDDVKNLRELKMRKAKAEDVARGLAARGIVECVEVRYDFKNTKISTGLGGVCRIFLPTSKTYPTLVASDTADYITDITVKASSPSEMKRRFIEEVYKPGAYRQVTKEEACRIQGFPPSYELPEARARWMRLIGNSVSVPIIRLLARAVRGAQEGKCGSQGIRGEEQLDLFPAACW